MNSSIMKVKIIFLVFFIFGYTSIRAQDPFFSQYEASPMTFNPSLIGNDLDAKLKVSLLSRNQWWGGSSLPFQTKVLEIEKQIFKNHITNDQFFLGAMFLNEKSNGGILNNTYGSIALNYKNILDAESKNIFSGAIGLNYNNRYLDLTNAMFQTQFGSMGFSSNLPSYDPVGIFSRNYFDLNAGLSFIHNDVKYSYVLGTSLMHINNPTEGAYFNKYYNISTRATFNSSIIYHLSNEDNFNLSGSLQLQSKKDLLALGLYYTKVVDKSENENITIGLSNRFYESYFPYVGIEYRNFKVGITYDIVTSGLKTNYNNLNSLEFSLIWKVNRISKHFKRRTIII